ncbi:type II secretion system protein N [Pseudomonas sp. PD9R]|uniref:type II secretion system protein N n=1 Tax=Pseudomonas sp. PD9R TaxID=2853534 RepID=UPI00210868F3|nr:type II secretion system protein N [Pseudomonas sp. PD9R]
MNFSLKAAARLGLRLSNVCLLALPVGYAVFVVWQEWQFRQYFARPSLAAATATAAPDLAPLDATAVATVLGLSTDTALMASAEPLILQASFVVSSGLSRALLADAQGPRMYQVGERLPGGSTLRRVEANHVVLWNKGREERLTLQPSAARFLRPVESSADTQASTVSTRFLRPLSGPSE